MNLVIDIGNTNIVFAVFSNGSIIKQWRIATKIENTADDYWSSIKNFIESDFIFEVIAVSTVVPQLKKTFVMLCCCFFNIEPLIINQNNAKVSFTVKSANIGSDRLANIIACTNKFSHRNLLIVDIGTAATFDLVDNKGIYYGSVLAPGPGVIVKSFSVATAMLPSVPFANTDTVVSDNLIGAMESGIFWGYVGLVEGIITKIINEEKRDIFVVGTGGFIEVIAAKTSLFHHVDINLTLNGINAFIAQSFK